MRIIDWQCQFTEHQSHTWLAAQQFFEEEIIHVVAKTSSPARAKQGWSSIDLSDMTIILFKQKGWFKQGIGILRKYPGAIHVFGAFWGDRRFFPLIMYAILHGYKVAVMNEPYATVAVGYLEDSPYWKNCLKVFIRPHLYRMTAGIIKKLAKPHRFCMLAMSARAAEQFEYAGFPHKQVFPFGYFVPKVNGFVGVKLSETSVVRVVFVGSLLRIKGLDLLVTAVEKLHREGLSVTLDVYGHGEPNDYIDPQSSCIAYKGSIPFGQTQGVVAGYDVLVLPSQHDGWGVVVNEALLQGVPVIVSSNVGAKCMIENNGAGMVFQSGNTDSLRHVLKEFIANPSLRLQLSDMAVRVGTLITPENAAQYMKNIFEFYFTGQGELPMLIWCLK